MRFYLSGASADAQTCALWIAKLEAKGHECVHDWTPDVLLADRPESALTDEERVARVDADLEGVGNADVFWLQFDTPSFGAGCELMHAVNEDVPTIIISGNCAHPFTTLATVRFTTHEAAFAWLVGRE